MVLATGVEGGVAAAAAEEEDRKGHSGIPKPFINQHFSV